MSRWHVCQGDMFVKVTCLSRWHVCQGGMFVKVTCLSRWHVCQGGMVSRWHVCQGGMFVKVAWCQGDMFVKVTCLSRWHTCLSRWHGVKVAWSDSLLFVNFANCDPGIRMYNIKASLFQQRPECSNRCLMHACHHCRCNCTDPKNRDLHTVTGSTPAAR